MTELSRTMESSFPRACFSAKQFLFCFDMDSGKTNSRFPTKVSLYASCVKIKHAKTTAERACKQQSFVKGQCANP